MFFNRPYPSDDHDFVLTQPSGSLNQDTVESYQQSIRNGQNPIVLTVSAEKNSYLYVVDDHHKLMAYFNENKVPVVITLSRIDAPRVKMDTIESQINLIIR